MPGGWIPSPISGCDLRIKTGDKLLIEGPSGGGKSTLASLLVGLRQPDSGLLLLRGLDRRTLGDANWRRLVVSAPQFHENHVLSETFAFNLLMGRRWPARPEDLEECEAVCRDLGLGELIDRMPTGLNQMVGETGCVPISTQSILSDLCVSAVDFFSGTFTADTQRSYAEQNLDVRTRLTPKGIVDFFRESK